MGTYTKSAKTAVLSRTLAVAPLAVASDVIPVKWATATKGGGFRLVGQNIAEVINTADSELQIGALATRGSRQNIELPDVGDGDGGMTLTTVPAVHSNGIAGAMIGGELGALRGQTGHTARAGAWATLQPDNVVRWAEKLPIGL